MAEKKKSDCPICRDRHYDLPNAEKVCDYHENWLVTECVMCVRYCFSETVHICRTCLDKCPEIWAQTGGKRDRRAILRYYGLEGWN